MRCPGSGDCVVACSAGAACNIVNAPERPTLNALVRDLTGERLRMRLEVLSVNGEVVDSTETPVGAGIATATWTPKLTDLGWYRATMSLTNNAGAQVGGSYVDFIWAPMERTGEGVGATARGSGDRPRFGLVIDDLPDALCATAHAPEGDVMGVRHRSLPLEGVQFHPESVLMPEGARIVRNFLTRCRIAA